MHDAVIESLAIAVVHELNACLKGSVVERYFEMSVAAARREELRARMSSSGCLTDGFLAHPNVHALAEVG